METQTENYNALPFAYNDYAISTNNQKQYDEEIQPHEQLTEKQQKLFDIRLKMNEARKKKTIRKSLKKINVNVNPKMRK